MAAPTLRASYGPEPVSDNSPSMTSSDDELFADINWPEDEAESPFGEGQFHSAGSTDPENDSPKNDTRHSSFSSGDIAMNGNVCDGDDILQPLESINVPSKNNGGGRFSKEARSILRTWFNEHKDNPYPTADEKKLLAERAGLKNSQISLWLVNTRRRYRSRKQRDARMSAVPSTMITQSFHPSVSEVRQVPMPSGRLGLERPFEELNPMDRWKVTPIEQEPAALPVILGTVAAAPPLSFDPYNVKYRHSPSQLESDLQSGTCLSHYDSYFGRSMASYETGLMSMVSGSTLSDSTAFSYGVPNAAHHETRDRRRRRGNSNKLLKVTLKDRPFQCTFCPDSTFATKHDWQRHEKSQHLTLESWTCCLSGGTMETEDGPICIFCDQLCPDTQHMETHSYSACQDKDLKERTFYRKDHFQQHLRLTHEAKFHSRMNSWKAETPLVRSRCGFCSATFNTWSARADHLASHFKCHATMEDWVGDWGFEPHIATLVERVPLKDEQSNPRLLTPSMPPPPHPDKSGPGGSAGYLQISQEQTYLSHFLGGIHEIASGIGPPAVDIGCLDLEGVNVSDWVDFGI